MTEKDLLKMWMEMFPHITVPEDKKQDLEGLYLNTDDFVNKTGYCPTCGSCGHAGCCSPDNCVSVTEQFHCEDNIHSYNVMLNEIDILHDKLRELMSDSNFKLFVDEVYDKAVKKFEEEHPHSVSHIYFVSDHLHSLRMKLIRLHDKIPTDKKELYETLHGMISNCINIAESLSI